MVLRAHWELVAEQRLESVLKQAAKATDVLATHPLPQQSSWKKGKLPPSEYLINPHSTSPNVSPGTQVYMGRRSESPNPFSTKRCLVQNPLCFPAERARVGSGRESEAKPGTLQEQNGQDSPGGRS